MGDEKTDQKEDGKQAEPAPKTGWKEVDQAAQEEAAKDQAEGGYT